MNKDWWLLEAGEYVLGTLRGPERDLFEKLLTRDADARRMVAYWERRFSDLDPALDRLPDQAVIDVPETVWREIELRLDRESQIAARPEPHAAEDRAGTTRATVAALQEQLAAARHWLDISRMVATAALASFLLLVSVIAARQDDALEVLPAANTLAEQSVAFDRVAIVSSDNGAQLWMIVVDESIGEARVVALDSPDASPEQSHQLWVVLPEESGVASLGLLPYGSGASVIYALPDELPAGALSNGSAFAVSVEMPGGTREPAPAGPVIGSGVVVPVDDAS